MLRERSPLEIPIYSTTDLQGDSSLGASGNPSIAAMLVPEAHELFQLPPTSSAPRSAPRSARSHDDSNEALTSSAVARGSTERR